MMLQRMKLDYSLDCGSITMVMGGYGCYVLFSDRVPKRKWEVHADGVPHEHRYAAGKPLKPAESQIKTMHGALAAMGEEFGFDADAVLQSWWANAVSENS